MSHAATLPSAAPANKIHHPRKIAMGHRVPGPPRMANKTATMGTAPPLAIQAADATPASRSVADRAADRTRVATPNAVSVAATVFVEFMNHGATRSPPSTQRLHVTTNP